MKTLATIFVTVVLAFPADAAERHILDGTVEDHLIFERGMCGFEQPGSNSRYRPMVFFKGDQRTLFYVRSIDRFYENPGYSGCRVYKRKNDGKPNGK